MSSYSHLKRSLLHESKALTKDAEKLLIASSTYRMTPTLVWREKVVQWCYDVSDSLQENRSLVYIAMRILDLYCATVSSSCDVDCCALDGETYELASMSAMFLAVRIAGSGSLHLPELATMSRGGITVQDFVIMGTKMIHALNWDHRMITPFDFLRDLLELLPFAQGDDSNEKESARSTSVLETANYLAEISVFDVSLSRNKASEIALASLLIALKSSASSTEIKVFSQAAQEATGIQSDSSSLQELCSRLEAVYSQSCHNEGPHLVLDEDQEDVQPPQVSMASPHRVLRHSTVHSVVSADDLELAAYATQRKRITPACTTDFVQAEQPPLKRTKRNLAEVL